MSNWDIVCSEFSLYKSILEWRNKSIHERFDSIDKKFGYDFMYDITHVYRSKIWNIIRDWALSNKIFESVVKGFKKWTYMGEG